MLLLKQIFRIADGVVGWMDGMDGRGDEWMAGSMDEWMNEWMHGGMHEWLSG